MAYNVENLADVDRVAPYDDYVESPDDPNSYGPSKMAKKLKTIATVMKSIGNGVGPDVVILNELEVDHTPETTVTDAAEFLKKYSGTTYEKMLSSELTDELRGVPAEVWLLMLQLPVQLLLGLVAVVAAIPGALLPTGRLALPLTLMLTAGLLPWLVAVPHARRWRRRGLPLLLAAGLGQGLQQTRDQLLLVHQAGSSLLIARHQGRGALVSTGADGFSCRRAARLRDGLGIVRFDWVVLLDVEGDADPCWQAQAGLVQRWPLGRISSPGLSYSSLDDSGRNAWLQLGSQRWLLLPDPVDAALLPGVASGAWRGLWLGRPPSRREQAAVRHLAAGRPLLVSGPGPAAQTVD